MPVRTNKSKNKYQKVIFRHSFQFCTFLYPIDFAEHFSVSWLSKYLFLADVGRNKTKTNEEYIK